jgi:CheY-like chemotaxis protein
LSLATVLIVDDQKEVRESIGDMVANEGYQPLFARGAADAVRKQRREPSDIILMDMKMSGMDGIAAARAIRKFDQSVEIVALTAYKADYIDHGKDVGITNWVDKPILSPRRRRILLDVIRRGIAASREHILGRDARAIAERLPAPAAATLITAVKDVRARLERPSVSNRGAGESAGHLETLGMLVGVALLIKDSPISADVFARVMFAEIGSATKIRRALQNAQASKIAADYTDGLVALQRLVGRRRPRR